MPYINVDFKGTPVSVHFASLNPISGSAYEFIGAVYDGIWATPDETVWRLAERFIEDGDNDEVLEAILTSNMPVFPLSPYRLEVIYNGM
jgi:hypothetical protein